jgi:GntR family transcriptional regulator
LFIRVEKGSATPVSRQIFEQVRAQCLSGSLKPGDCVPSVRSLAAQLAVNVNTIVRVYERLQTEGLVEMRHGDGTYVRPSSSGGAASRLLDDQRAQYVRELEAIVRRGLMLGLGASELRRVFTSALAAAKVRLNKEVPASAPASGRRSS